VCVTLNPPPLLSPFPSSFFFLNYCNNSAPPQPKKNLGTNPKNKIKNPNNKPTFATGDVRVMQTMCTVVVGQTSCNDRNHPILRGVITPHQEFFFFAKIMIFLDF
jgi:hypothetical protein